MEAPSHAMPAMRRVGTRIVSAYRIRQRIAHVPAQNTMMNEIWKGQVKFSRLAPEKNSATTIALTASPAVRDRPFQMWISRTRIHAWAPCNRKMETNSCLLYTSDAADE